MLADAPKYEKQIAMLAPEFKKRGIKPMNGYVLIMPVVQGDETFCEMVNSLTPAAFAERGY